MMLLCRPDRELRRGSGSAVRALGALLSARPGVATGATGIARSSMTELEFDHVASPINVTAMRDVDDADHHSFVEDLVDDAKLAPPRRVPPLQLIAKWFAGPVGILGERASNELPTRDGHGLR